MTLTRLAVAAAIIATPLVGVAGTASAQTETASASLEFVDRGWHDDNGLHLGHDPLRKWLHHVLPRGVFGSVD
ncbi:hypothetical protein ACFWUP_11785 [Nocardia sp. NPDC058658]|uniref:hypothetical protein n=1 Tax=Nocardia sp. NPDC058658 TaxID=3346580 RepID=UPI0036587C41